MFLAYLLAQQLLETDLTIFSAVSSPQQVFLKRWRDFSDNDEELLLLWNFLTNSATWACATVYVFHFQTQFPWLCAAGEWCKECNWLRFLLFLMQRHSLSRPIRFTNVHNKKRYLMCRSRVPFDFGHSWAPFKKLSSSAWKVRYDFYLFYEKLIHQEL